MQQLMKALSKAFGDASIEYMKVEDGAFVRVDGLAMGVVPNEMLNDPHPDQLGVVVRDVLIKQAMSA